MKDYYEEYVTFSHYLRIYKRAAYRLSKQIDLIMDDGTLPMSDKLIELVEEHKSITEEIAEITKLLRKMKTDS